MKRTHRAAVVLGRLGGTVRSAAKARAARRNGKKGGRPRRKETGR
jgi:hypothetical protein